MNSGGVTEFYTCVLSGVVVLNFFVRFSLHWWFTYGLDVGMSLAVNTGTGCILYTLSLDVWYTGQVVTLRLVATIAQVDLRTVSFAVRKYV